MITLLSHEDEADFLAATSFDPIIGARIYTLFQVFDHEAKDVCFWRQMGDAGKTTAAISRFDGWMVISADNNAEKDELCHFIRMAGGFQNLEAAPELCYMLRDIGEYDSSVTMTYENGEFHEDFSLINESPKLEDVYNTIAASNSWFASTSNWQAWYPYTSHLLRHDLGFCRGIYENGRLVSTGGVYTMGEKYAVIGGLATLPEYRGKGYAGLILRSLVNGILVRGKTPSLFCASDNLADYYGSAGFHKFGRWGQITL